MTSKRRLSIGVLAVGLAAAGAWWLSAERDRPSPAPATKAPSEAQAPLEPSPRAIAAPQDRKVAADDGEPVAAPLPRDEVVLPEKQGTVDGGVVYVDPASREERRDRMLGVVLDRLHEDQRQAEDAEDEDRAAQLQIRIDRLEERRSALKEP